MTKDSACPHSVSQKPYIIYCGFWYTCKIMISQQFFHFFKILIFQVFSRGGVKVQEMTHNYQFHCVTLNMPRTLSRFLVHRCKIMISPGVFLYFLKEYSIVNIKILTFFTGLLQQFFLNKQLFFKFINKCHLLHMQISPTFFTCM